MWILISFIASFSTALTTIVAKIALKNVNSDVATFVKTAIVAILTLIFTFITGSIFSIGGLNYINRIFLVLSGIATGLSWLFYFKAIKLGSVNEVAPIDKSSFILTSILFLIFFFDDTTKNGDTLTIIMLVISMLFMLSGTLCMVYKKGDRSESKKYLIYAILSSVFASLVSLFVKLGLKGIDSNLGTMIRTFIVLLFTVLILFIKKESKSIKTIDKKSWLFLILSGILTVVARTSEYYCLAMEGVNPIAVQSIIKLSILFTMLFSLIALKEKFTKLSIFGLCLLITGIILIVVFSL